MEPSSIPQSSTASLQFDLSIYPLVAVEKAAYEFSGRVRCLISRSADNQVSVEFGFNGLDSELEKATDEFVKRVADLAIQTKINSDSRLVREALVSAALSEALRR